ncbi:Monocarboxylate transporter 13 [Trichinella pseudospiralis]|uniref:Monocarboxylate transporter 13 n=1 Tax=Trichinella pseudospiralis TaxID=6337 RepID=A0A0V0XI93_TRIPS|nr:Monocarboxylate transporter 13 [Trichinella pseudospiralis]KRX87380.1 Monocarboxylate transporter 13 [Trichinella pseudospiralis]
MDNEQKISPLFNLQSIVIVISGFMCQMIAEGVIQAQDVFPPYIKNYFKSTIAEACVSHAVMHGCAEILGPVSTFLTKKFGARKVLMFGAATVTLGFITCAFASKLIYFNITSAIAGLGFGIMSVPMITVVSFHFKKHRYLMTTVTMVGGALGAAVFPFLFDAILDTNPWQITFSMIACLTAQLLIFGMLLSSNSRPMVTVEEENLLTDNAVVSAVDQSKKNSISTTSSPLLSKVVVFVFLFSSLLWHLGCYVFEILPVRLDMEMFNGDQIAMIISVQAIFAVAGRLLSSGLVGKFKLDPVFGYNVASLTLAAARTAISWQGTYITYLCYVSISGLSMGVATALAPVVVLRLVGLDRLNFVYGFELFVRGLSGMIVPVLSGLLADSLQGNFFFSFITGGILLFASTVLLLPYHWPLSHLLRTFPNANVVVDAS